MSVQELMNGVIYVGTVVGAITGLGAAFHFAILRPFRKFLRNEIVSNLVEIKDGLERQGKALDKVTTDLTEHVHIHKEE